MSGIGDVDDGNERGIDGTETKSCEINLEMAQQVL